MLVSEHNQRESDIIASSVFAFANDSLLNHKLRAGQWKENEQLNITIGDFKSQSEIIGHTIVKFALLVNPSLEFSSPVFLSILEELDSQIQTLFNIYSHILNCSIATCLYDEITNKFRGLLYNVDEFLRYTQERNKASLNYVAGLTTKLVDEIKQIPAGNKAAYRRNLLQKCLIIKETITEFEGYVSEAKTNLEAKAKCGEDSNEDNEVNDDDEDDLDEGDDEIERDYSAEEVITVEKCLNLCTDSTQSIKYTLKLMTDVADQVHANAATSNDQEDKSVEEVQIWVALIERAAQDVENTVIDLGSELYPPVSSEDKGLVDIYQKLISRVKALIQLVQVQRFIDIILNNNLLVAALDQLKDLDDKISKLEW